MSKIVQAIPFSVEESFRADILQSLLSIERKESNCIVRNFKKIRSTIKGIFNSEIGKAAESSIVENTAEFVGGVLGARVVQQVYPVGGCLSSFASSFTSLIGSYISIRGVGSEERLIVREAISDSYIVKSLQAFLGSFLMSPFVSEGIIGNFPSMISTFCIEAVCFNAKLIYKFIHPNKEFYEKALQEFTLKCRENFNQLEKDKFLSLTKSFESPPEINNFLLKMFNSIAFVNLQEISCSTLGVSLEVYDKFQELQKLPEVQSIFKQWIALENGCVRNQIAYKKILTQCYLQFENAFGLPPGILMALYPYLEKQSLHLTKDCFTFFQKTEFQLLGLKISERKQFNTMEKIISFLTPLIATLTTQSILSNMCKKFAEKTEEISKKIPELCEIQEQNKDETEQTPEGDGYQIELNKTAQILADFFSYNYNIPKKIIANELVNNILCRHLSVIVNSLQVSIFNA